MRPVIFTLLLLGCGGDKTIDTNDDDGLQTGGTADSDGGDLGCDADNECADWQICEERDCVDGDRNNSFTEAEAILPGSDGGVSTYINTAGDKDYWRYTSPGSEFIRASVDPHDDVADGVPVPDTFVTLYAPDGTVVTSADDYPNGRSVNNYDSVIYAYLAAGGDYIFMVEDANPMWGETAWGGEDYTYTLKLSEWGWLTAGSDSTLEEPFRMDDDWTTGVQMTQNTWNSVGILLEEEGEVDYIAVQFDSENLDEDSAVTTWTNGYLYVDGIEDLSGSDATPVVQILAPDDVVVSEKVGFGTDGPAVAPALSAGEWILALSDADGGGGPNHWFVVMLNANTSDNNYNWESEPNDGAAAPNAIDMPEYDNASGKPFSTGTVQGFVDSPGDTDFFTISAPEESAGENPVYDEDGSILEEGELTQWVVLCMNSARWGSSIAPGLTVYGEDGSILAEQDSSADENPNLRIENIEITPGEELVVQVNPGAETLGTPDEWYMLKAYIASFEVSSYEDGGYSCP